MASLYAMCWLLFFVSFRVFSLCLAFSSLTMTCLGLFVFVLFCFVFSWPLESITEYYLPTLLKKLAIFFFLILSLYSFENTNYLYLGPLNIVLVTESLFWFFSMFSSCPPDSVIAIDVTSNSVNTFSPFLISY